MILKDFIRDNKAKSMMNMEVMETQTFDEEDWIEVWLK